MKKKTISLSRLVQKYKRILGLSDISIKIRSSRTSDFTEDRSKWWLGYCTWDKRKKNKKYQIVVNKHDKLPSGDSYEYIVLHEMLHIFCDVHKLNLSSKKEEELVSELECSMVLMRK